MPDRDSLPTLDTDAVEVWRAVSSELLHLMTRIEEIDPVVKALGVLEAGFHGVETDVDAATRKLSTVGARQRNRLDRLEDDVARLLDSVERLEITVSTDQATHAGTPPVERPRTRSARTRRQRRFT